MRRTETLGCDERHGADPAMPFAPAMSFTRKRNPKPFGPLALLAASLALGSPALAQERDVASPASATSESAASDAPAGADGEPEWRTSLALSGTPKYDEGFEHFDYVNPDAPKGGTAKLAWPRSFDSLNPLLPKGTLAPGLTLTYETLLTPSLDEQNISAQYGLIAEAVKFPDDLSSVTFRLDPDARWHDGELIDAEDVIWSFETSKEINPRNKFYYRNVIGAEETAPGEVTFTFDEKGNRELPYIMGQLLVLPEHWWGAQAGDERRIDQTRLDETPVGSGPYRIASINAGKTITYERVPDFWGADEPVYEGKWNFDEIAYEVFSNPTVRRTAFGKNSFDWIDENSAKNWATAYNDLPALKDGRIVREEFLDPSRGLMQAFVPNLRRERFQDARVRRALNLAFDFETTREDVFYGQYERGDSFFDGTELASTGLPEGREAEILREVQTAHPDLVPESVFTEPYSNPVAGDQRTLRQNLREADGLLREAGWELVDGKRIKDGEVFRIEYLEDSPLFEPIVLPWQSNLERLGIEVSYRFVDQSQAVARERSRDFDVMTKTWAQSLSPGNEQREYWGSAAADEPGSQNVAGIANPAIDMLIERVIFAPDRDELVAATRALDRLLLANDYVIPQWISPTDRTLRWDKFGHPEPLPEFGPGWPEIWWYDEAKAQEVER